MISWICVHGESDGEWRIDNYHDGNYNDEI